MDLAACHRRAREKGANPILYFIVRITFQPFFHIYFRLKREGMEHVPKKGGVIIASNHRSFLDPFVIAVMARRPMYYVAKQELFNRRWQAWVLNALGAFPVKRGEQDEDMLETSRQILARGDIVLIFPEGTRIRPGSLGEPKRGVGRLALETGAPVVPLAIIGTESVRRGWRIRPHKVKMRAGRPLHFPQVENPSPALAGAVTARIWPCVMLQWEWLGGLPPIRRAAILGAGSWGTSLAITLARAGYEVDLGCRTAEQAAQITEHRENTAYLPGITLPDAITVKRAADMELGGHDLIVLAVPSRALPSVLAAHGERIPRRAGILMLSKGLVPPLGTLPSAFTAERCRARAIAVLGGPSHAADAIENGASVVLASLDKSFSRQLSEVLTSAGLDITTTTDVTGVELAGCAKNVAALAAAATGDAGPNVGGAAAGKIFAEVERIARSRGGKSETFAGLAGAGDLVATVVAPGSRNRRAGELLAQGVPIEQIGPMLGQAVESVDTIPLLTAVARDAHVDTPALDSLAALVEGKIEPERWTAAVTHPKKRGRSRSIRAA